MAWARVLCVVVKILLVSIVERRLQVPAIRIIVPLASGVNTLTCSPVTEAQPVKELWSLFVSKRRRDSMLLSIVAHCVAARKEIKQLRMTTSIQYFK